MTDQIEGNAQTEGAESQSVSAGKDKPFDGDQSKLVELLEKQSKRFESLEKELRGLQGKQDKGDKQFREFMADYQKQLSTGKTESEAYQAAQDIQSAKAKNAEREALLDALLAERSGKSVGAETAIAKAKELASKYGLDENDPDFVEIATSAKPEELEGKLAIKAFQKTAPASLSSVPSMPATPAPSKMGQDQVEAKSAELARLYKEPSKNRAKIALLEKELEPFYKG